MEILLLALLVGSNRPKAAPGVKPSAPPPSTASEISWSDYAFACGIGALNGASSVAPAALAPGAGWGVVGIGAGIGCAAGLAKTAYADWKT